VSAAAGSSGSSLDDLERSTLAALSAGWNAFEAAARRQTLQFAASLQRLKFAKQSPGSVPPGDTLESVLWKARSAYCESVREAYQAFEGLVVDAIRQAQTQEQAAGQLYQQRRPAAWQSLTRILGEVRAQDLGQHAEMNQRLLQAQLEDDNRDHQLGVGALAAKMAEAYASHKYVPK
jgi:hypothetical protein